MSSIESYEIKLQEWGDNTKWEDIDSNPFKAFTGNKTALSKYCERILQEHPEVKEIRANITGSCQGHYFSNPIDRIYRRVIEKGEDFQPVYLIHLADELRKAKHSDSFIATILALLASQPSVTFLGVEYKLTI